MAILVYHTKIMLCPGIPLLSSPRIPFSGFIVIIVYTPSLYV